MPPPPFPLLLGYMMAAAGMSVEMAEQKLKQYNATDVEIACDNGRASVTFSGTKAGVIKFCEELKAEHFYVVEVETNGVPYHHSKFLAPCLPALRRGEWDGGGGGCGEGLRAREGWWWWGAWAQGSDFGASPPLAAGPPPASPPPPGLSPHQSACGPSTPGWSAPPPSPLTTQREQARAGCRRGESQADTAAVVREL